MNVLTTTLLVAAALWFGTACRDSEVYGMPAPAAGTGGGAGAPSSAVAMLTGFMGGTVTGAATFAKATGDDVSVTVALANCMSGKAYPVHIHAGTSCADAMMQGDHWGPTRGEGIPNVMCAGTTGMGTHTRTAANATTKWTIGGDTMTDVVGHAFVVHSADMPMQRVACGVITAN